MYKNFADARLASFFHSLRSCPILCYILFASLLMPTNFSVYIAELRFAPYRFVLILAFFPCMFRLASGTCGKMILTDWLVFAFAIWNMVVLAYHHGMDVMLKSGGVQSLELVGAYLIARTAIRTRAQFIGTMTGVLISVSLLVPFTVYESVTGHHLIKQTAAQIMGGSFSSRIEPRLGFTRAFGSFDHPILWGTFAASAIGIGWGLFQIRAKVVDLLALCLVVVGTLSSVSSGALVAVWAQFVAIGYERITRSIPSRWTIFWFGLIAGYAVIELGSTRSAFVAVTTRISFSSGTAYGRAQIFHYGMQNIKANPIMGIGLNEWSRPGWLSTSVDNFWLLTTMMYGVPGFLMLAGAVLYVLLARWKQCQGADYMLRFGWTVTMAGLIVAGGTVHYWNNIYVYFTFLIGCGAVFVTGVMRSDDVVRSEVDRSALEQGPVRFFR